MTEDPSPNKYPPPASAMTVFAGLCLFMSLFFPRFLLALPILGCLALATGAFLRKERWRLAAIPISAFALAVLFLGNLPAGLLVPEVKVTYLVTGSSRVAAITMTNGQGGLEQKTVELPWSEPISDVHPGQFVSISAQNQRDYGDLTCEIQVDGAEFKTSTSSSAYGIAACSGSVP